MLLSNCLSFEIRSFLFSFDSFRFFFCGLILCCVQRLWFFSSIIMKSASRLLTKSFKPLTYCSHSASKIIRRFFSVVFFCSCYSVCVCVCWHCFVFVFNFGNLISYDYLPVYVSFNVNVCVSVNLFCVFIHISTAIDFNATFK